MNVGSKGVCEIVPVRFCKAVCGGFVQACAFECSLKFANGGDELCPVEDAGVPKRVSL